MAEKKRLRNRNHRASLVAAVVGSILAAVLAGVAAVQAAELAPLRLEENSGVSADPRGRYSERMLTVAIEVDRDGTRLVAFTVKERPLVRPLGLPSVRTIDQGRDPQIEVVLIGPGSERYTQRQQIRGLCLLHSPGAEPHIDGDTIRLHRDTILVEVPEVAGFDRIELAFHEEDPLVPARRSLGVKLLDAPHFTPAGGKVRYDSSAIASAEAKNAGVGEAVATSGQVHWPEEYGDSDIFRVAGNEAEINRRINVTVVPDGYTYAEKALMDAHFDAMVTQFRNKTPYKEHDAFVNYILVYAYSNESETDQCDCDIVVDTAMATRFYESNPQCGHSDNRCLYYGGGCDTDSSGNLALAELRAPFPPGQSEDSRLVMVNTTRYGGCAGYRAVYSAGHASGIHVAVHELGHSLGGLADEYSSNTTCGGGAGEINTSLNGTTGAWPEWIADIGAPHEGAQYYEQCVYRPEENCEMRSLNQPFCKVCRQRWALVYFSHPNTSPTAPLESMNPTSPADVSTYEPTQFSVTARLATGTTNEFNWTIDGPGYAGPTPVGSNALTYEHTFTQPGTYTLRCQIIADTNFIKPQKYGANRETAIWQVDVVDSSVDHDGDGFAPNTGDCDDGNILTYPGAPEVCDGLNNDCDDPGWPTVPVDETDDDSDGYAECQGDCDDAEPLRSPGLAEAGCDGLDNDCDGGTSDILDADADTHACDVDCDDGNTSIYPAAPELCDGLSNDCNDPGWPSPPPTDRDDDTDGYSECQGDCDDSEPLRSPDLPEAACDGLDNDCDGGTPDVFDADADTHACDVDCDDDNLFVYPAAPELCDGLNNDCEDPGWPVPPMTDTDDDADGYAECQGDCDDADPQRSPGLPEVSCDGLDNDCDGGTLDAIDADSDTHTCDVDCDDENGDTYPGAPEVNDGLDNQCPGDVGYGFTDEIGPALGFGNLADPTELCWPVQAGATDYEVARSDTAYLGGCIQAETTAACWNDVELPPLDGVYHYLVRALGPNVGSLGGDSAGAERVCAEITCDDGLDNDGDTLTDCDDPNCLGIDSCTSATFQFVDTDADDIASTGVKAFFDQLRALPADFIQVTLQSAFLSLDWCSARADFYRDQYLALAPTAGSAVSGTWDRWSRTGAAWQGPDTSTKINVYGTDCDAPYAWCPESAPSGFTILLSPDQADQCETRVGTNCTSGSWELTIQVGVDRLAACGF